MERHESLECPVKIDLGRGAAWSGSLSRLSNETTQALPSRLRERPKEHRPS
jgi:hypothetical protein